MRLTHVLTRCAAKVRAAARRVGQTLGLIRRTVSQALARAITPWVLRLLRSGAIVVSDQPFADPSLEALDLPPGIEPGRYFLRRLR